jgi:hypothetical protein
MRLPVIVVQQPAQHVASGISSRTDMHFQPTQAMGELLREKLAI